MKNILLFGGVGLLIFILNACSTRLYLPLKDGVLVRPSTRSYGAENGINFFINPNSSIKVIASEKSVVLFVKEVEGRVSIYAEGNYEIYYGNLKKSFVKEGDVLRKGQVIGNLDESQNKEMESLIVTVRNKNGKYIVNSDVFKK